MTYPYFHLKRVGDRFEAAGTHRAELGYRLGSDGDCCPGGVFAQWNWDGAALHARVDRLGFCSLFYWASADQVMVSPSPLELVARGAPAAVDDGALGVFMRLGLYVGHATPFGAIRVLPAGGQFHWSNGQWSVNGGRNCWSPRAISKESARDGFIELFRAAVTRHLSGCRGEIVVPLSGGRDSRHILLEMKRQGVLPSRVVTYNYNPRGLDAEAESARRVAEAVGVRQEILPGTNRPLQQEIRAMVALRLCSDEGTQMLPLRDFCAAARAGGRDVSLVDGIGGDVLSRNGRFAKSGYTELFAARDWHGVANRLMEGHAKLLGTHGEDAFDAGQVRQRFGREAAVDALAGVVAQYESAADPRTAFLFDNRTRREIALVPTGLLLDAASAVVCPYLDGPLVEHLASLPSEITADGRFHDDVIAAAYPEYASLPYQEQITVPTARRSPGWKLANLLSGARAVSDVRGGHFAGELFGHLRMAGNESRRAARTMRVYRACLELASSGAAGARRLLDLAGSLGG